MTPERWRQIEDLYNAAQNCRPEERAALLDGTDPEIRARVERMLEIESGSGILYQSPADLLADATQTVVAPGAQLGPYKIEIQIGSGGMGTVYRATDTRLGRVVAIKFAVERYNVRFRLEAQAISTLNHPNICTLYDVGPNYLVMEFIDGPTLGTELKKGPLAHETVAQYGAQIASALAEAHSLGIVHRDLKPSNIMLTRHGIKVLDFGLAKMLSATAISETNAILGTPAYMAPEQVDGREPTPSTDLFALGLVLYEMSVGHLPIPGASLGQILSSGAQPFVPLPSGERAGVPAALDGLVSKLLEKDPVRRPQSAVEVGRVLSSIAVPERGSRLRTIYAASAAVLIVLLLVAAMMFYRRSTAGSSQPPIPNPATFTQLTSFTDSATQPALSPDGRMLAFYRTDNPFGTTSDIWLKLLPNGEPIQITHDSRPKYNIAFTPDGSRIAYSVFPSVSRLFDTYEVSSLGGNSELFFRNSAGLTWLDTGRLLFSQIKSGIHMGIVTSNPDGSAVREIYFPAVERGMAHYSYLSPDKQWLLLAEMNPAWQPCRVVPFSGGSGRQVGPPGAPCTSAAWSLDGKWMYLGVTVGGRSHLWRQRFPDGQPEQLTFGSNEELGIAMASDGRSLITSIVTRQDAVWIHDSQGDHAISTQGYADPSLPRFSADGKRLYYLLRRNSPDSPSELSRTDLDSGKSEVVVPGISMRQFDVSERNNRVVFTEPPTGQPPGLWIATLDRSAPPRRIGISGDVLPHFGPNGEVLFRLTEGEAYYLGAVAEDGTGRRKALPDRILNLVNVSPDRRFAVVTAVMPNVTPPPTVILPVDGGSPTRICELLCSPAWSPDGRYLYLEIADQSGQNPNARTAAIPLSRGELLPRLTPELVHNPSGWAKVARVQIIDRTHIAPGPNPSTYAYIKPSIHANLFRIPLQ